MTYCLYIFICLCLIVIQTTVMPYISLFERFYDLLTPFIIYLSIFRSVRESLVIVFVFGFFMDIISGGPFGLYLTAYVWLFIGVRWAITFLHVGDSLLLPFVVAAGVLMENLIFIGTSAMFEQSLRISETTVSTIMVQVLWAVFTGPLFLMFFNYSHRRWDQWHKKIFVKKT
jgi:cell shape-determining protein MreD